MAKNAQVTPIREKRLSRWLLAILTLQISFVLLQCALLPNRLDAKSAIQKISKLGQEAEYANIAVDVIRVQDRQLTISGWAYNHPSSAGMAVLQVLLRSDDEVYVLSTEELVRRDVVTVLGNAVTFSSGNVGYLAIVPTESLDSNTVYQVGMLFQGPFGTQHAWGQAQFSLQDLRCEG